MNEWAAFTSLRVAILYFSSLAGARAADQTQDKRDKVGRRVAGWNLTAPVAFLLRGRRLDKNLAAW